MDVILKMAGRARTRLMLSEYRQHAVYHVAGALAVATIISWIVRPGGFPVFLTYLCAVGAGLISAAVHAAYSRPSIRTAALALDQASGLRERLSTALLVRSATTPAEVAVLEDASRVAASADPGQIPLAPVRRGWWPLVPPLVFVASLALPNFTRAGSLLPKLDAQESAVVPAPIRKEESSGLRRRAFDLEHKAAERNLPEMKDLAQAMRQISEDMRKSEMNQADALTKLSKLEDKVRERRKELAQEAGLQSSMFRKGEGGNASAAADEASRRAEELNKKVEELKAKIDKAKGELGKPGADGKSPEIQAMLAELGKQLEGLEGKDLEGLAKELEKAAAEGDPKELEKLLEAMKGEAQELEGLLEGMDMLADELGELQAMKGRFTGDGKACLFCGRKGEG